MSKYQFWCCRCGEQVHGNGFLVVPRPGWTLPVPLCGACYRLDEKISKSPSLYVWADMTVHELKVWCGDTADEVVDSGHFRPAYDELVRRGYTWDEKFDVWWDPGKYAPE